MYEGFGVSGIVLVRPGRAWNTSSVRLRRLGCALETSWGHLGTSWEDPGGVLASLGSFLGAFDVRLAPSISNSCYASEWVRKALPNAR